MSGDNPPCRHRPFPWRAAIGTLIGAAELVHQPLAKASDVDVVSPCLMKRKRACRARRYGGGTQLVGERIGAVPLAFERGA
jgi:hypothetical protein